MKFPGLDGLDLNKAFAKLDKFDEMQPVLEEIRDSLSELVNIQRDIYLVLSQKD